MNNNAFIIKFQPSGIFGELILCKGQARKGGVQKVTLISSDLLSRGKLLHERTVISFLKKKTKAKIPIVPDLNKTMFNRKEIKASILLDHGKQE